MKHWLAVTSLSVVLCFLFGAWWGHRLQDQKTAKPQVKATVSIAAEKNSIPESLKKKLFEKYQVRLVVQSYETPADLLAIAKSNTPPDLVLFPSYMFRSLQKRDLLGPLDTTTIPNTKNISKDLRFGAWDPQENFAVPMSWNGLFFIYNPKKFSPGDSLAEVLKNKKAKVSLKRDLENVVWLSQVMDWTPPGAETQEKEEWLSRLTSLPWSTATDIEKFRKGDLDLLQLSWSEIQNLSGDLGEYRIWYPAERSPFFLDFIALSKASPNHSKAQKVIHQILDEEVYPEMVTAEEKPAAVMDLTNEAKNKSAHYFRQLPLTRIRPLVNAGYDLGDLERARVRLFESPTSAPAALPDPSKKTK